MSFIQYIPLLNLVWVIGAFIINQTVKRALGDLEDLKRDMKEVKEEVLSANLSEIPKKVEALQIKRAELSSEMESLWRAIENLTSTPKQRAPKDRDS